MQCAATGVPGRVAVQCAELKTAAVDQLRDHTGQKAKYWLVLNEIIRAAPCFFLRVLVLVLAWY
jgi:hypothetical protein